MATHNVVLKQVAPQWIASVRQTIRNYPAVSQLFPEVFAALGSPGEIVIPVALWHDPEYRESDVDAEAGVYLSSHTTAQGRVRVYQLPEATVASVVHHGAYQHLPQAYERMFEWIETNEYRIAGPLRELYLVCTEPVRQDDPTYVTEIQAPVTKT